jgi:hypothetical protein
MLKANFSLFIECVLLALTYNQSLDFLVLLIFPRQVFSPVSMTLPDENESLPGVNDTSEEIVIGVFDTGIGPQVATISANF